MLFLPDKVCLRAHLFQYIPQRITFFREKSSRFKPAKLLFRSRKSNAPSSSASVCLKPVANPPPHRPRRELSPAYCHSEYVLPSDSQRRKPQTTPYQIGRAHV